MICFGDIKFNWYQERAINNTIQIVEESSRKQIRPIINMFLHVQSGASSIVAYIISQLKMQVKGRVFVFEEHLSLAQQFTEILSHFSLSEAIVLTVNRAKGIEFNDDDFIISFLHSSSLRQRIWHQLEGARPGVLSVGNESIGFGIVSMEPEIIAMPDNDQIFDYRDISIASYELQMRLKQELSSSCIKTFTEWPDAKDFGIALRQEYLEMDKNSLAERIIEVNKGIHALEDTLWTK